ncbi:putative oxidoreductasec [Vanrija pseudolonga]|uniref:Purtative oxidoreductasec n=1 Tax=Vanrija pseudolonga TaxID=143232 RepID=A0AAF1BM31_9TREE|nr:purtative oxidoreductasec [Vanrija pseudolonga]
MPIIHHHIAKLRMASVGASLEHRLKMRDGHTIPQFGLGVYDMSSKETYAAVRAALAAGYKHVDTAEWYYNEADVGRALADHLKDTGAQRSDYFITSKLMRNRSYAAALSDLRASLGRAGLDYFDLYLLHSPIGGAATRKEVWRALVDARSEGLVRSVGVSNFGVKHLDEMQGELPAVNQVDLHPWMRHEDIVAACEARGILLEAWAPLARGIKFDDPALVAIAKKHGRDKAQILLRWGLQHGFIVIPKSVSPARIASNANVLDFALDDADMQALDALDEYLVTDWDVVDVE